MSDCRKLVAEMLLSEDEMGKMACSRSATLKEEMLEATVDGENKRKTQRERKAKRGSHRVHC